MCVGSVESKLSTFTVSTYLGLWYRNRTFASPPHSKQKLWVYALVFRCVLALSNVYGVLADAIYRYNVAYKRTVPPRHACMHGAVYGL